jgi:IMP dehydrogenase
MAKTNVRIDEHKPNEGTKIRGPALTFDDVLLIPSRSSVLPSNVETRTRFSRSIELNIPLVSAAMDTVTETKMAIALARHGGIGVVHKRMTPERQAEMVRNVKRSQSGMIVDPITLPGDASLAKAEALMREHRISGVPVVEEDGRLVGIITNRDLRFEEDLSVSVSDRMTKDDLISVPEGTTLREAREMLRRHRVEKLLVVDDDFRLKGLITIKDLKKRLEYPLASKDALGRLRVAAAVGVSNDLEVRASALVDAGVDALVLDSAHGHSQGILDALRYLKASYQVDIVAGNIATAEGALDLIKLGVDAVKVGIGPGSICTTRIVTGVGIPQLTAILDVGKISAEHNIPLIADGGIKNTGDIPKAIAAGAHTVMIGSLLAGTEASPGEMILRDGRRFKEYRGMGSMGAMGGGSSERYFQEDARKLVPEGIEGMVPYQGSVSEVLFQLVGGLRSAMGYCGTPTLHALQRDSRFITVTQASLMESHPHDVTITKDAPNYAISRRS